MTDGPGHAAAPGAAGPESSGPAAAAGADAPESSGAAGPAGEEPTGHPIPADAHRRRHRRVVALSAVDRERLASGELASEVAALHQGDAPPVRPAPGPAPGQGGDANDERLRRDVPPHWGRI
ncbi:hypothetical protein [Georgenia sp. SYP-B2076]|uniref:hypothetical protein n=1 Tax=Georgenia sp. SYP-B2076 TaxID=2495881 RepID=UPI00197A76C7|nr:hypothetical protein [Georgenia sp. SYP-B2076]